MTYCSPVTQGALLLLGGGIPGFIIGEIIDITKCYFKEEISGFIEEYTTTKKIHKIQKS